LADDEAKKGGVNAGGVTAVLALAAIAILAAVLLLGDDDGHHYELLFETGGQLVEGNEVLVGGQPIGTIDEISLTDDAQAEVAITTEHPLHEGTTAQIRLTSLSGIANRYISVHPGPNSADEIPEGGTITTEATTSPVDLDQFFNTFDRRTREAVQDFIQGQAAVYAGNYAGARRTYKYFAPGLQATERLLAELTRDQQVFSQFLAQGDRALGAIAERRNDLSALTENANRFLGAIARRNVEFDRALVALPPALRQSNTTFVNLRAALDDLQPLIAETGVVADDLAPFLRNVRSVADPAIPVLGDLRATVNRAGPDNDLADALGDLPGAERAADRAVEPTLAALDDAQPEIEFAIPYTPDLLGFITKFGQVTAYYDANGHYARVLPASQNLFAYDDPADGDDDGDGQTEDLNPIAISEQFDFFAENEDELNTLGPFRRCPGGATQPNPGFPSPEDHPFLGRDDVVANDCDPNDVPPGP